MFKWRNWFKKVSDVMTPTANVSSHAQRLIDYINNAPGIITVDENTVMLPDGDTTIIKIHWSSGVVINVKSKGECITKAARPYGEYDEFYIALAIDARYIADLKTKRETVLSKIDEHIHIG